MVQKPFYTPPEAEIYVFACIEMLATSGFNDDNNTEYFGDEYGGLL